MNIKQMKIASYVLFGIAVAMILANLIAGIAIPGPKFVTFAVFMVIVVASLVLYFISTAKEDAAESEESSDED